MNIIDQSLPSTGSARLEAAMNSMGIQPTQLETILDGAADEVKFRTMGEVLGEKALLLDADGKPVTNGLEVNDEAIDAVSQNGAVQEFTQETAGKTETILGVNVNGLRLFTLINRSDIPDKEKNEMMALLLEYGFKADPLMLDTLENIDPEKRPPFLRWIMAHAYEETDLAKRLLKAALYAAGTRKDPILQARLTDELGLFQALKDEYDLTKPMNKEDWKQTQQEFLANLPNGTIVVGRELNSSPRANPFGHSFVVHDRLEDGTVLVWEHHHDHKFRIAPAQKVMGERERAHFTAVETNLATSQADTKMIQKRANLAVKSPEIGHKLLAPTYNGNVDQALRQGNYPKTSCSTIIRDFAVRPDGSSAIGMDAKGVVSPAEFARIMNDEQVSVNGGNGRVTSVICRYPKKQ